VNSQGDNMKYPRTMMIVGLLLLTTLSGVHAGISWYVDDYRVKAEQGDSGAQYNLGNMYRKGEGVLQDYKEAVKWYRKSAEQGHAKAQYNLALMYAKGEGVIQDDVMAHMYINIAAVSGDKDAVKNRGIVAKRMTPSQLEKAQDLAREWMRSH